MSINKVILLGHVGEKPQARYFSDGRVLATVALATDEVYTLRNGTQRTRTEWHELLFRNAAAEHVEAQLQKGDLLYAEGRIITSRWQDTNGYPRVSVQIEVQHFQQIKPADTAQTQPSATNEIDESNFPF